MITIYIVFTFKNKPHIINNTAMKRTQLTFLCFILLLFKIGRAYAQSLPTLQDYSVSWNTQSLNSSESMPCGGGEIGMNVWCENGDILFYFSRSSAFDENNALLKLGRIRLQLPEANFNKVFRQELTLSDGCIRIYGDNNTIVTFWADVFHPVIHVEVKSDKALTPSLYYENWRNTNYALAGEDAHLCGLKGTKDSIFIYPDTVAFKGNDILFYHRNHNDFIFQKTVDCEELQDIKDQLWNPVKNRTFGGIVCAPGLVPAGTGSGRYIDTNYKSWKLVAASPQKNFDITITTHIAQTKNFDEWHSKLKSIQQKQMQSTNTDRKATRLWWKNFWQRSHVFMNSKTDSTALALGRNYQLFRYMLACNAYGDTPTKFNGSLFTFDPSLVKPKRKLSPDFRQWGGASMTAQNQRLVYWPMLKSGDWDMMDSQFSYYLRMLDNAKLMTRSYWNHPGACFTEQIENFGLPVAYSYGMEGRNETRQRGKQANAYCEYLWDTVMDFCLMMIRTNTYEGRDIKKYIPFIEDCLTFFDEHYRMFALQRTVQPFDRKKHYVFYPGTAGETYKMATNSTQTIAALTTVLRELLALPQNILTVRQREKFTEMLSHMPPLPMRQMQGHTVIAPAQSFERLMNVEINQLYPVFPYDMYGLGHKDLELARDTWRYGIDQPKWQKNRHESWHQDAIFCARLGLLPEARDLVRRKLQNGKHRFPAFFGPGHDWTPDHNWGGTGMIALQEMLMQNVGDSILLLPCWPKEWDVNFKLHAPKQTTVECVYRNGKIEELKVTPQSRAKDIFTTLGEWHTTDTLTAQRCQTLDNNWEFSIEGKPVKHVTLPHTWNAEDAQESTEKDKEDGYTYKRGCGTYSHALLIPTGWKGKKRVFVRFKAASQVANVFLNNKHIAEHKGAFTAFCVELTDYLEFGKENILRVDVDNRWRADVPPLSGGFAMMGGLYRGAELIVTDLLCISPLHYASDGIYVDASTDGQVKVRTHVDFGKYSNGKMTTTVPHISATLTTTIYAPNCNVVTSKVQQVNCESGSDNIFETILNIDNPQLWNGVKSPALYSLEVKIHAKDDSTGITSGYEDKRTVSFGFRHVSLDKERGFLLNGAEYPVHGVARHQDADGKGWALTHDDNLRDMNIMQRMGATAIRMAHYPQSADIHYIADSLGLLVWDEIPLVNEVRNSYAFNENTRQQMLEMVHQLYNNPSVCWWGLFNEIDYPETSFPHTIFNQLNDIAHKYGGNRLTASASNKGKRYYNGLADAPAWNNYPGWYWMLRWPKEEENNGTVDDFGKWIDFRSEELGGRRFAISEYGAGGNPLQHMEGELPQQMRETMNSTFHPEEWQNHIHEETWRTIKEHEKQLWGSFVWAMFDFIVPGWSEGEMHNLNTKGLVSHDRKTFKDSYFFYKANWNDEPMTYISSRRMDKRHNELQQIKVYSNCDNVTLYINGKKHSTIKPDSLKRCIFDNIRLKIGENIITVEGNTKHKKTKDSCIWTLEK